MAFGKSNATSSSNSFSRYYGIANVNVIGVNPTMEEIPDLLGYTPQAEPAYVGASINGDDQVRINFVVKDEDTGFTTTVRFNVNRRTRVNRDGTKCQVIDKYGNTQWVTKDELSTHAIPKSSKTGKPLNIDASYRPCWEGEADLNDFLRTFLDIRSAFAYNDGQWTFVGTKDNECRLDEADWAHLFKGDVTVIKQAIALAPDNKIKVMFGVRTADNGQQYQDAYTRFFLQGWKRDNGQLINEVKNTKAAGGYPHTEFYEGSLREYVPQATNLETPVEQKEEVKDPWSNPFENTVKAKESDLPF